MCRSFVIHTCHRYVNGFFFHVSVAPTVSKACYSSPIYISNMCVVTGSESRQPAWTEPSSSILHSVCFFPLALQSVQEEGREAGKVGEEEKWRTKQQREQTKRVREGGREKREPSVTETRALCGGVNSSAEGLLCGSRLCASASFQLREPCRRKFLQPQGFWES